MERNLDYQRSIISTTEPHVRSEQDQHQHHLQRLPPPPGFERSRLPPPGFERFRLPPPGFECSWLPPPVSERSRLPPPGFECSQLPPPGFECTRLPPPGFECTQLPPPGFECFRLSPPSFEHSRLPPPGFECSWLPPPGFEHYRLPPPGFEHFRLPPPRFEHSRLPPQGFEHSRLHLGFEHSWLPPPGFECTRLPPPNCRVLPNRNNPDVNSHRSVLVPPIEATEGNNFYHQPQVPSSSLNSLSDFLSEPSLYSLVGPVADSLINFHLFIPDAQMTNQDSPLPPEDNILDVSNAIQIDDVIVPEDVTNLDVLSSRSWSENEDGEAEDDDDNETMTYEDLLNLQEQMGHVSTGLSKEEILRHLNIKSHTSSTLNSNEEPEICVICQKNTKCYLSAYELKYANLVDKVKEFFRFAVSAVIGNIFSAIFTFFFALEVYHRLGAWGLHRVGGDESIKG
ncbi:hypothetical protein U1Q18_024688 [Sarracenia purpurea var. burkii]